MRKVAAERALNPLVQEEVRAQNNPELLKEMELVQNHRQKQLIRHGKSDELERPKTWPLLWMEFRKKNKLPVLLVEWWVQCGVEDVPGLMVWRNEALTKFIKVHLDQSNLSPSAVKKTRQQLGLVPVGDKKHFVWDCRFSQDNNGNREIKGYWRNGKQSFCVGISPKKDISKEMMTMFISH